MLTDVQSAYLAGFFDGEGTLGVYKVSDPRRKTGGFYYRVNMKIVNTHKGVIFGLCEKYGGSTVVYHPRQGQAQTAYTWSVNKADLQLEILLDIFPYLIVKKEQAEIVIEFLRVMKETRWQGQGGKQRTGLAIQKYERLNDLYIRTKELNGRWHSEKISGEFGETPNVKTRAIPSQASEGKGPLEGVTTIEVSPNNNPRQEYPTREGRDSLLS